MSEFIISRPGLSDFRWRLLTTVSALSLIALTVSEARAEDGDHPTVWIELGGQLSRLQDGQEVFTPPFVALTPSNFTPPQEAERPPLDSIDVTGKISFQPNDSDWTFSASIRYGRASTAKHVRHQSYPDPYNAFVKAHGTSYGESYHFTGTHPVYPIAARFTDARVNETESHTILDFQAGRDFGIGLFGHEALSSLNVGVRFAQFTSKSRVILGENPDWHFKTFLRTFHFNGNYYGYNYNRYITQQNVLQPYHSFAGAFRADRSFTGVGPSISWTSAVPFAGNSQNGELALDWGVNAALLFGRQKSKTHHQTTGRYSSQFRLVTTYQNPATPDHTRSRNSIVPNVGAFAGASFNYPNVKVSLGYRADFFFGALDGGIDTRKAYDRSFYGPFANVSIGLGG